MSSHSDSIVASGSSPTGPDFICENHGSVFLIRPISLAAFLGIHENLPADRQMLGNAVAVEHRYIWSILDGIQDAGLVASRG